MRQANHGIGSWVKHGKVVCQTISFHSGKFYIYVYRSPTGNWSLLHDNIVGINDFLREEIYTKELTDKFIQGKDLVGLLFYNMGARNTTPITDEYMQDIEERYGNHKKPWGDWSDDALRAKLKGYALPSLTVVKDNQWTLELNLLTEPGGMEHWLYKGTVYPLQVKSYTRELAEPDGSFPKQIFLGDKSAKP